MMSEDVEGREAAADAAEMESGRVGKVALLLARPESLTLLWSLTTGRGSAGGTLAWAIAALVQMRDTNRLCLSTTPPRSLELRAFLILTCCGECGCISVVERLDCCGDGIAYCTYLRIGGIA
jgi:hypothetical protein